MSEGIFDRAFGIGQGFFVFLLGRNASVLDCKRFADSTPGTQGAVVRQSIFVKKIDYEASQSRIVYGSLR
jgi:hypothetical protein